MRKFMIFLVVVAVALGALWIFGPREPADTTIRFDAATLGDDPDAFVQKHEAGVANLRPEAAKEIVWAFPQSKAKTPYSIVYVHGFSATKGEVRPLPDKIAAELGANVTAQYLQSDPHHSYLIMDVDSAKSEPLRDRLEAITETIRVRTLW